MTHSAIAYAIHLFHQDAFQTHGIHIYESQFSLYMGLPRWCSHFHTFAPSCLCEVAHRDVPILQINKRVAPGNELVASPGLS